MRDGDGPAGWIIKWSSVLRQSTARHASACLAVLLAIAIALRFLLVVYSPQPFGYVWDYYHEGVRLLYSKGRLPASTDCWQCYHPPLFYVIGWPFYAFQRWMAPGPDDTIALRAIAALSLLWSGITIYYGYKLLRLFRCRGASLLLGMALLFVFPCLFISSYAAEADILLTAIASAIIYYLTRYFVLTNRMTALDTLRLGILAGLAASTKYSGLVVVASIIIVFSVHIILGPRRWRALRDLSVVLMLCVLIGGWKYLDNIQRFGTPLYANGEAAQGFSVQHRQSFIDDYEFTTLRLGDVIALFPPEAPDGTLTRFPVYQSVFTTLHALAWTDMSFFSVPTRHGDGLRPYPFKTVPRPLVAMVLTLGLVPDALAVVGFLISFRHRALWPLAIVCSVTAVVYGWWFTSQALWGLKTKYVLFVVPPSVLFAVVGLGWITRKAPVLGALALLLLAVFLAVTHVYLLEFAIGRV